MAVSRNPAGRDSLSSLPPCPEEIRLLTLNCWGLLHISALRSPRILEIGRRIAAMDAPPNVVCFQELFCQEDFEALRRETSTILPHAKFYHSGAFGAGLAIFSRWPITSSSMVPYQLNGRPTAFWRGDWYVGKGIACATIRFGPGPRDVLEVFNTHTHAPYEKGPKDTYVCHRTAQAWQMAKLVRSAVRTGHLVAALGDFNMLPRSLAHRIMTAQGGVRDVWRIFHPDSSLGPSDHPDEARRGLPVPSADFNLLENGATSNNVYNTWRWTKAEQKRLGAGHLCPVDPDTPDPRGQRLDYIFVSTGQSPDVESSDGARSGWVVESANVVMTERHPDLLVSLSDHFAVMATLTRHTSAPQDPGAVVIPESDYNAQLRYAVSDHEEKTLSRSEYTSILAMIFWYISRERSQRHWRGVHFYSALVVWVACLVAVWFSPRNFVAFILMLFGSTVLLAGFIDGLLALLFFSWEIRSLKEFEWEVLNSQPPAPAVSDPMAVCERGQGDKHEY
ncbi:unnamed protein product [Clonostachys rosea]|uniref:Endonuclease/exonuclease/phosphatase domain-containing protein n=1 Tax=Bionectria ochroleuca TaxID=29856 RepID=A0ABY6URC7_BIOOC|nr:unnamed protein product [Clonostachys rosea]